MFFTFNPVGVGSYIFHNSLCFTWGVKFETILLKFFHPIFLPIFLFESGFSGLTGFSGFDLAQLRDEVSE